MLPPVLPTIPATTNEVSETATIKSGFYSLKDFQALLQTSLDTMKTAAALKLHYYTTNLKNYNPLKDDEVIAGYFLDDGENWKQKQLALSATDIVGFGIDPTVPENKYVKTSATPALIPPDTITQYDAYGMADTHYFHYAYKCPQQTKNNNLIVWETAKHMSTATGQKGRVAIGLYSKEYMDATVYTGGAAIISGGTFQAVQKRPRIFLCVEYLPQMPAPKIHERLRISVALNTVSGRIENWDSINKIKKGVVFNCTPSFCCIFFSIDNP